MRTGTTPEIRLGTEGDPCPLLKICERSRLEKSASESPPKPTWTSALSPGTSPAKRTRCPSCAARSTTLRACLALIWGCRCERGQGTSSPRRRAARPGPAPRPRDCATRSPSSSQSRKVSHSSACSSVRLDKIAASVSSPPAPRKRSAGNVTVSHSHARWRATRSRSTR